MNLEEIKRLYREHFLEIEKEHNKYKYPGDSSESFESFLYQNKVDDNTVTEDMKQKYINKQYKDQIKKEIELAKQTGALKTKASEQERRKTAPALGTRKDFA